MTILLCGQVGYTLGPISGKEDVNALVPEMGGRLRQCFPTAVITWDPPSQGWPQELEDLPDCNCSHQQLQDHLPEGLIDRQSSTPLWW